MCFTRDSSFSIWCKLLVIYVKWLWKRSRWSQLVQEGREHTVQDPWDRAMISDVVDDDVEEEDGTTPSPSSFFSLFSFPHQFLEKLEWLGCKDLCRQQDLMLRRKTSQSVRETKGKVERDFSSPLKPDSRNCSTAFAVSLSSLVVPLLHSLHSLHSLRKKEEMRFPSFPGNRWWVLFVYTQSYLSCCLTHFVALLVGVIRR